MEEKEIITGEMGYIKFQKDGFLIAEFLENSQEDQGGWGPMSISIVGNMMNPQKGLMYKLSGEYDIHPRFGKQFKFVSFETLLPLDTNGIFKYLVRSAKWVGPGIGNKLVDEFGEKTLEILKTDPGLVAEKIKGLTLKKAQTIQKYLLENEENEKVNIELSGMLDMHGVPKKVIPELIKKYKSNAPEALRQNPYILTQFHMIGFLLADRVALHLGYDPEGIERKCAAILHVIGEAGSQGHTWIDEHGLLGKTHELIGVENIAYGFCVLQDSMKIVKKNDCWTKKSVCEQEQYIAKKIIQMIGD